VIVNVGNLLVKPSLGLLAKQSLRAMARKFGYEVRKVPFDGFKAAPVFELAVRFLMLKHGEALRFIQVGANDGIFGDPLRKHILAHKWTGVLVEPQPEAFEALKSNYAGFEDRLSFENVAITGLSSTITLYRAKNTFRKVEGSTIATSSVASLNPRVTSMQLGVKPAELEEISVPTARLDALVEKYALHDLDLLQIDTEGHEPQVLDTLDLSKTKPKLIQFEHGHLPPKVVGTITASLNAHDYLVYYGGYQADSLAMHKSLFES
jgi:FkbM family methyltransferase